VTPKPKTRATGGDRSALDEPKQAVGAEALEDALGQAYRFLSTRDRTVAEMRRHLTRKGLSDDLVQACVAELTEQHYLDDERFAKRFTEDRRTLDGWGTDRIRARLVRLGIDPERADRVTGGREADEELAAAVEVLRQKLRELPADDQGRARALGLLTRRGYDLDLAYDAIRRFTDGPDE